MKIARILSVVTLGATALAFSACEQNGTIETIVNKDGSIERNIVLSGADSSAAATNVFGINKANGWAVSSVRSLEKSAKYDISFSKSFASIEAANKEMDNADDAVFHIRSDLQKKFRWFFTYYRYSDTYASLNRLRHARQEDYFTPEDYAFINRLPAEGKPMSKADSFFLEKLGERVYEDFAARGFYEESFHAMLQALEKTNVPRAWQDSVLSRKESYFRELLAEQQDDFDDYSPLFSRIKGFPGDTSAIQSAYKQLIGDFERRSDFMSTAVNLKLGHVIQLPWPVIRTNADSVANNRAYWAPPSLRYTLNDYTMYAEGRALNMWAVALSAGIIALTVVLYIRRRNSRFRNI